MWCKLASSQLCLYIKDECTKIVNTRTTVTVIIQPHRKLRGDAVIKSATPFNQVKGTKTRLDKLQPQTFSTLKSKKNMNNSLWKWGWLRSDKKIKNNDRNSYLHHQQLNWTEAFCLLLAKKVASWITVYLAAASAVTHRSMHNNSDHVHERKPHKGGRTILFRWRRNQQNTCRHTNNHTGLQCCSHYSGYRHKQEMWSSESDH